jgi:hypothetical protein
MYIFYNRYFTYNVYGFYSSINWQLNSDLYQSHPYNDFVFQCYCLGLDIMLTNHTQTGCTHECNHPVVSCGYDSTVINYAFLSIYKMNPRGKFLRYIKSITNIFLCHRDVS